MPSAGKSPEEWVGQKVVVEIVGPHNYEVVARLDGIGDWGLVLAGADPTGTDLFYPWHHVMAVRLASSEDEPPDPATHGGRE